ncbi:hypothetical protein BDV32DRAFT_116884 [Aspergillus pseudonomiae]|nr:hypothetical protein BDV32DRAFT_116884 [Aspergillus pseudonomiae]
MLKTGFRLLLCPQPAITYTIPQLSRAQTKTVRLISCDRQDPYSGDHCPHAGWHLRLNCLSKSHLDNEEIQPVTLKLDRTVRIIKSKIAVGVLLINVEKYIRSARKSPLIAERVVILGYSRADQDLSNNPRGIPCLTLRPFDFAEMLDSNPYF